MDLEHPAVSPFSFSEVNDGGRPKKGRSRRILLDEEVFCALFDAGLRSSIASKPIRLVAGVKCLSDQHGHRLCDLVPATFVPGYVQRLQEQAQFIPGISRVVTNFLNLTRAPALQVAPVNTSQIDFNRPETKRDASEIQRRFWDTVRNGQGYDSARRLPPLRRSSTARVQYSMLDLSDIEQQGRVTGNGCAAGGDVICNSEQASEDRVTCYEDLFNVRPNLDDQPSGSLETKSMVTTEGINWSLMMPREGGLHDVEHGRDELYDCLFEEEEDTAPLQHESRKYSNSLSQMSDVSMFLALEAPMEDARIIGQAQSIGGSKWLTQKVIRMHPLRQQQHESEQVDQRNLAGTRDSLYVRPDLGWWSDTSDASEEPLEACRYHLTQPEPNGSLFPSVFSNEEGSVQHNQDIHYESETEDFPNGRTKSMSVRQTRENSDGSLAEVIGSDHLLWHMWKRRASVAPRGEEDIIDMKSLFATDPDMKLFSSRWDLSPSDISSSSNEDPMLQESDYNQSSRAKAISPITPTVERRSYPTSTRSSPSSGYVGRTSADPGRRSSLIKRFTWGGRQSAPQAPALDMSKLEQRTMEVKRRKTLDDYESMDKEASNDESGDMLF